MEKTIRVKVVEGFCEYNHDQTVLLCDVNEGDEIVAELYELTKEYFGKDFHGRKVNVGEIDVNGALILRRGFELFPYDEMEAN